MIDSWEDILQVARLRMEERMPLLKKMELVRMHYNAEWVLPVPGSEGSITEPSTPALIAEGVDQMALRATQVMPDMQCPPLDATKDRGTRSIEFGNIRRKSLEHVWQDSQQPLLLGKGFRHLCGYATMAFLVKADLKRNIPTVSVLNPLGLYPEAREDTDFRPLYDCAAIYCRSGAELIRLYPRASQIITSQIRVDQMWDVLEWVDEDKHVVGILGPTNHRNSSTREMAFRIGPGRADMELDRWTNKLGICPVVMMTAISLDKAYARLANFTHSVELMGKLTALVLRGVERSTFPDKYALGRENEIPSIVGGTWKEGTTGDINLLDGVSMVGEMRGSPDPQAMQMVDRLERGMRVSYGLNAQMSGENTGSLRTGRAIDSMAGLSIDPRIAEIQREAAVAIQQCNTLILTAFKEYWPSKKFTLFSTGRSEDSVTDMVPKTHIETTANRVKYTVAGADADALTIRITQLVGAELISHRSGREMHPMIDDPEGELHRIQSEQITQVMMSQLMSRAQDPNGGLSIPELARIAQLILEGKQPYEAVQQAHKESQALQASIAPPAQLGQAAPPESMAGLGNPGEGQQQPLPPDTGQATTDGLMKVSTLLRAGRNPYAGKAGPLG